jgi:hypothetical protein
VGSWTAGWLAFFLESDGSLSATPYVRWRTPAAAASATACDRNRGIHSGKHTITGTVHRVAFYDSQFRISNIISQTDIIK